MHKPNFPITAKEDGKTYWISRSVAVVAVPIWAMPDGLYIPLGKRSEDMTLYPGHWGIPCGFLDWGESASDAVCREVVEEIGLNLRDYTGVPDQPELVITEPNPEENDTVSLRFIVVANSDELPTLGVSAEATEVRWAKYEDCLKMDLAFNHKEIIEWACNACGGIS